MDVLCAHARASSKQRAAARHHRRARSRSAGRDRRPSDPPSSDGAKSRRTAGKAQPRPSDVDATKAAPATASAAADASAPAAEDAAAPAAGAAGRASAVAASAATDERPRRSRHGPILTAWPPLFTSGKSSDGTLDGTLETLGEAAATLLGASAHDGTALPRSVLHLSDSLLGRSRAGGTAIDESDSDDSDDSDGHADDTPDE